MPDFRRGRGEAHAAWLARLAGVDLRGLTPCQLDDLTYCRVQAGRVARRIAKAGAPEPGPLGRCLEALRDLSPREARQLLAWLKALPDV